MDPFQTVDKTAIPTVPERLQWPLIIIICKLFLCEMKMTGPTLKKLFIRKGSWLLVTAAVILLAHRLLPQVTHSRMPVTEERLFSEIIFGNVGINLCTLVKASIKTALLTLPMKTYLAGVVFHGMHSDPAVQ